MVEFYESLEQLGIEVPQPNYDSPWAFSISVIENSWELKHLVTKMRKPPEAAADINQLFSMPGSGDTVRWPPRIAIVSGNSMQDSRTVL